MEINQIIAGKYEITEILKSTQNKVIAKCIHQSLRNPWLIKYVNEHENINELEALLELEVYHIPKIIDYYQSAKGTYYVLEYIPGMTMDEFVKSFQINTKTLVHWMLTLGKIIADVHGQGYVHGDIKPENIMIVDEKDLVLIDFGSCFKEIDSESFTFEYVAPERLCDLGVVDDRSDIYSFGLIFREILSKMKIKKKKLVHLVQKCCEVEIEKRPRMVDVIALLNEI
ncbi:MAG: protein kinase [Clostridia bacterium]|nr:protein kinase [Clostridia bacterium]